MLCFIPTCVPCTGCFVWDCFYVPYFYSWCFLYCILYRTNDSTPKKGFVWHGRWLSSLFLSNSHTQRRGSTGSITLLPFCSLALPPFLPPSLFSFSHGSGRKIKGFSRAVDSAGPEPRKSFNGPINRSEAACPHAHTHSWCAAYKLDKLPLILQRGPGGYEWGHGIIWESDRKHGDLKIKKQ